MDNKTKYFVMVSDDIIYIIIFLISFNIWIIKNINIYIIILNFTSYFFIFIFRSCFTSMIASMFIIYIYIYNKRHHMAGISRLLLWFGFLKTPG
jgi:hypothetical protein